MNTNDKIIEAIGELEYHIGVNQYGVGFSSDSVNRAISILKSILEEDAPDAAYEEWFTKLWNGYPSQQWDGSSAPARSKTVCKDRFPKTCRKHGATPEQCVKAIAAYVRTCREHKQYIKGLETILKTQPVWVDYLEGK